MRGRGPYRLAERTGPPPHTFLALTFMETSCRAMALRDGSCTEFYKDTLFGLEGELKGWDKWEFLRWMGTRLAFSAFVGITDALAQGNLSLGSHWAGG